MEKDRGAKIIAVVAVVIAIVGLTVGLASFSTTLKITGTGTVKASNWDIKFANLQDAQITGTAVEDIKPTLTETDTHLNDYKVTFNAPGDAISYTFDIKNEGTFNAKITSLNVPTPQCTSTSGVVLDQSKVCDNLEYKLTYDDGTLVKQNDTINSNETKKVKLTLTYKAGIDATQLPSNDVTIGNLGININYGQE